MKIKKNAYILLIFCFIFCSLAYYSFLLGTLYILKDVPFPVHSNEMIKTNFFKYSRDLYHIDLISSSLNRDKSSETIPCDLYLEMSSKGKVYWSTNITLVKEGSHIPLGRLEVKRTGSFDFVLINKKGIPFKDGEFNIRITLWKGRFVWLVLQTYFFLITGILIGLIGLFIIIIDLYKNKKTVHQLD